LIVAGTLVSIDELRAYFAQVAMAAIALNVLSMAMGFALGSAFSLRVPQRVAITFEIGVQNLALASYISLTLLQNREFFIVALIYGVFMKISAMSFVFAARKWLIRDAAVQTAEPARVGGPAGEAR
jgi:BASS family bile acid:Na+ symporter